MSRFCVACGFDGADNQIRHLGAKVTFTAASCALGLLSDEHPTIESGPFSVDGLTAVGEASLFNRRDLIAGLKDEADLNSCSDGQIVLHFFKQGGLEGLRAVHGMFALAIWDGEGLTLVRDPMGSRTLFYAEMSGCWMASSSLRALRRWPNLSPRLNLAAVRSFLTFAYLPGRETLLDGVYELPPASFLKICPDSTSGTVRVTGPQSYWEPEEQPWNTETPIETYATCLRQILEQATVDCLPDAEPVGVFLSGGLDSSLVAALAKRLHNQPVLTYSINFGRDLPNELAYSSLVAAHCRTEHQILTFSGRQMADHLAETVALLDCPVGDPLTVPNLLLARAAAADGLRVILNGEGGDPCFGGPKNVPMLVYEWHRTNANPLDRARAYLRAYRKCYLELPHLLSRSALEQLRHAPPLERLVQPFLEAERMPHYLNRLFYANTRLKGAHHILPKVERLTASCGLEGRAPLFAPAIVDYSFAVPPQFKLKGVEEKWVLKLAADDLLPSTIVYRPKSGMRVPVQAWLDGPLKSLAQDLLLGRKAKARGLFNLETIRQWLNREGLIWPRHGANLWLVLTLELWLRAYNL